MKFPEPFRSLNSGLTGALKCLLIAVFVLLVLDVLWGVFSRYVLSDQSSWSEELARFLMVWLALLGAAYACREQSHLGLDAVVRTWPPELRRAAKVIANIAVLVFAGWILAYGGTQWFADRLQSGQTLPALGISKAWFYLPLPISGFLMSLFVAEDLWNDLFDYTAEEEGSGE